MEIFCFVLDFIYFYNCSQKRNFDDIHSNASSQQLIVQPLSIMQKTPLRPRGYKNPPPVTQFHLKSSGFKDYLLLGNRIKSSLFCSGSFFSVFHLHLLQHFPVATSVYCSQIIAETFFLLALRGHGIRLVWKNSAWFYSHCLLLVKRGTKQTLSPSFSQKQTQPLERSTHGFAF